MITTVFSLISFSQISQAPRTSEPARFKPRLQAHRLVSDGLGIHNVVDVAKLTGNDSSGNTIVAVGSGTDHVVGETNVEWLDV
jgi:hypothetical protein